MLELEIKALREEIVLLREAIVGMAPVAATMAQDEVKPKADKPKKAEPAEKDEVVASDKPVAVEPASVTLEDLQALCTTLMRSGKADRDQMKEAIREVIGSFGVSNLAQMDKSDYQAAKAKLEVLL